MRIEWKSSMDRDEVVARIAKAIRRRKTLQRDRLRAWCCWLAMVTRTAAGTASRSDRWACRAFTPIRRPVGWAISPDRAQRAIGARKQHPGRRPKLTPEQEQKLKARLDAGPVPQDKVCTLRGKEIRRIIEAEFGAWSIRPTASTTCCVGWTIRR